MSPRPDINASHLRGISRLTFDGIGGLVGIVETMHGNIAGHINPFTSRTRGRTRGITSLVYRSVRAITHLTGSGVDAALALADPVLAAKTSTPGREAWLAALNGVLGDHLAATGNPLAIPMRLRHGGQPLELQRESLEKSITPLNGRLALMVHGLCMNDLQWSRDGHDHGVALARDFGYSVLYLHYNSGRHISINGRAFADLLESLAAQWPVPLEELVIVGHSMGGLVARSACHYASAAGHRWPVSLRRIVFLGTPHHGAPMERGGQWLHLALSKSRYTAAFTPLGRIRSAGITDLRHGNLLDNDWQDRDRFEHAGDTRQAVPLPMGVACYAMGASLGKRESDLKHRFLGDGLVPLDSALGRHKDPHRALPIPEGQRWVGHGMSHFDLLSKPDVYRQMSLWLQPQEA